MNIIELFKDFKSDVEQQEYIQKQHQLITSLMEKNKTLEAEVEHLKSLLLNGTNLSTIEPKVEKIIIQPEEVLIERQIQMIQDRGYDTELSLEDTKKLDLLLKNKKLVKEQTQTIEAKSIPLVSNDELIKLAIENQNKNGI